MTTVTRPWAQSPTARIGGVVLLMGALLTVPAAYVLALPAPKAPLLSWWILALLFAACESLTVHFDFRGQAYTFTLIELALVVGLHAATPAAVLGGFLVGMLIAQAVVLRQRPLKMAFNLVNGALEVVVTFAAYHAMAGSVDALHPLAWLATPAAVIPACLLTAYFVTRVVRIATGELAMSLRETLLPTTVGAITNATLGLGAVVLLRSHPFAAVIIAVPTAVMYACYRAWGAERRQRQSMQFLYRCVRSMQLTDSPERAVTDLLNEIVDGLSPRVAELSLLSQDGATVRRTSIRGRVAAEVMQPVEGEQHDLLVGIAAGEDSVLTSAAQEGAAGSYFRSRGLEQGIVTLLRSGNQVFGVLVVADRLGDVETFGDSDAELIGAIGVQAGALLESDRLHDTLGRLEQLQSQLEHAASHDALTALANRRLFSQRLEQAIVDQSAAGIMFIDLDGFKRVNDELGHAAGDELLVKVADRLATHIRPGDLVARLGGDEFAVLVSRTGEPDALSVLATRLRDALNAPMVVGGQHRRVGASIGVAALSDSEEATVSELLRRADWAMYQAKISGKGRVVAFTEDVAPPSSSLGDELGTCLSSGGLSVVYQPILELASGRSIGAEALARWNHPTRGMIPPDVFVPMAEDAGLVGDLTQHMLRTALSDIGHFQSTYASSSGAYPWVSINLSPRELSDRDLVERVLEAFDSADIDPRLVVLELTESALLEDLPEAVKRLRRLQARGLRIALDDFGSGFSSLGYLSTLPVDILKIDRSYVQPLRAGTSSAAFLEALVNLGHSVGAIVLAEGVEDRDQVPLLARMGCDLAQGFALGRPTAGLTTAIDARTGLVLRAEHAA